VRSTELRVAEKTAEEISVVSAKASSGEVEAPGPISPRSTVWVEPPARLTESRAFKNMAVVVTGRAGGSADEPVRLSMARCVTPWKPMSPGISVL